MLVFLLGLWVGGRSWSKFLASTAVSPSLAGVTHRMQQTSHSSRTLQTKILRATYVVFKKTTTSNEIEKRKKQETKNMRTIRNQYKEDQEFQEEETAEIQER